jgi:drug/metabolite transporter (DMT)-like permease
MIYILLSILCSVTVGILFKLARRYKIDIPQAIAWNYLFAIGLCLVFFDIKVRELEIPSSPIYIYLGILLPGIFLILSRSIKEIGIAKTDIAQRLSLLIPIVASYYLFAEQFTITKVIALVFGLAAIVMILFKPSKVASRGSVIYPVLVFVGYGIVDVLFKKVALMPTISYPTSLLIVFLLAFSLSFITIVYLAVVKKQKFQMINFVCGAILGLINFSNIYFYLKAHKALSKTPSIVFASMNLGVIVLGTIVGVYIFREKLSRLNIIGVILALLSIVILTVSSFYEIR